MEKKEQQTVKKLISALGKNVLSISKKGKNYLILIDNIIITEPTFKLQILEKVSRILKRNFEIILLSELWDSLIEGKNEVLSNLLASKILYDSSMIEILKVCLNATNEIKEKFEKHLLCAIVVGSLVRGEAEPSSDIDMAFIIDDTDLKDMDRADARKKLFSIVNGIASSLTKRTIQCQVYLLTEFWESLRDAHPVIFTMLRDGIPIYDTGLFKPWKLLLKLGKIKPTAEAIETHLISSELLMSKIKENLQEMAVEDLYLAMLNPAQAALMLYGIPPMTHKETPKLMDKFFVKREKFMPKKYVNWLSDIINLVKAFEHGKRKEKVTADELAKHMKRAEEFLSEIGRLFEKIRKFKFKEDIEKLEYECRDFMKKMLDELNVKYSEKDVYGKFKQKIFDKGTLPKRDWHAVKYLTYVKDNYQAGNVSREEIIKAKEEVREFIRNARDYLAEKNIKKIPKALKVRFKHGKKEGDLWVLEENVFLVKDLKKPHEIFKGKMKKDGEIKLEKKIDFSDFNKKTSGIELPKEIYLSQGTLESLKKILKEKIEVLVG